MTPAAGDGLPRAAARGQSPSPQPSPVKGEGVGQSPSPQPFPVEGEGVGQSPSPQPSPVKGKGVRAPISIFPPNGGRGGITPARPPLWIPAPYRVRGRLFAGMTELCKGLPRIEYGAGCARERRLGFLASRAARGGRVSNPPLQSRATRCRAALGESPSPQPSPVEGEGVRAPISIFPPNGGRGGSPLPVRPSGFRPRIEYGAGFSPE